MFQERYMSTRERLSGDEDEFFKYYKQYRSTPPYSSSRASSEELMINDNASSSNSSSVSNFRNTLQNLLNLPSRGLHGRRRRPPCPIRSRSEETGMSCSSRFVLKRKPQSFDRCFLPELREDSPTGNGHKRTYDETLSRDSGHSSGGSPDLRSTGARVLVNRRSKNQPEDISSFMRTEPLECKIWRSHLESWELELHSSLKDRKLVTTTTTTSNTNSTTPSSTMKENKKKVLPSPAPAQTGKQYPIFSTLLLSISVALLSVLGFVSLKVMMCHNNRLQPFNPPILKKDLEDNLFGQHIAQSEILSAVTQLNGGSVSVLIFMGSSGTGKTLATDILCHQFPVPGNIHRFSAPFHFASSSSSHFDTLDDLSHHIPSSCGYSMVIFDDIDNIESDSSEYIASFIASLEINPISRRRSNGTIVVISSRNAGPVIDEYTLNHARSGYERQDITQDKLHLKLKPPVLNIVDVLLKRGIRVSIVPFLPLTRDHVRKCIAREMNLQGISYFPQSEVNNFMEEMSFFASDFPIFSSVGCKKIHHELSVYNNRGDGKTF